MRSKVFHSVVLAMALFLYAFVMVVLTDSLLPAIFGLLLLPPIVWSADALGIADMMSSRPVSQPNPQRQYTALRSKVKALLDIARRMNWQAVDLDRGIREGEDVEEEMDRATKRMKELVDEIRLAAGRARMTPEILLVDDPTLNPSRRTTDPYERGPDAPGEADAYDEAE